MPNKLPKFLDNHKICIICEGNEEYEYLNRLKDLKVWNEQYDISLVNAGGNGNIPARYQDRYQNGADELVLVCRRSLLAYLQRLCPQEPYLHNPPLNDSEILKKPPLLKHQELLGLQWQVRLRIPYSLL